MLKPVEYYFLMQPFSSKSVEMIKYTLQDLCLRKVLEADQKWIYLSRRSKRRRHRFFFELGPAYDPDKTYDDFERFLIKPFESGKEIRFYKLRKYIESELYKAWQ